MVLLGFLRPLCSVTVEGKKNPSTKDLAVALFSLTTWALQRLWSKASFYQCVGGLVGFLGAYSR